MLDVEAESIRVERCESTYLFTDLLISSLPADFFFFFKRDAVGCKPYLVRHRLSLGLDGDVAVRGNRETGGTLAFSRSLIINSYLYDPPTRAIHTFVPFPILHQPSLPAAPCRYIARCYFVSPITPFVHSSFFSSRCSSFFFFFRLSRLVSDYKSLFYAA